MGHKIVELEHVTLGNFQAQFAEFQHNSDLTWFFAATRIEMSERIGSATYTFYEFGNNTAVLRLDARHYRDDRLTVEFEWVEALTNVGLKLRMWIFQYWGGPNPGWGADRLANGDVLTPRTPGVEARELSVSKSVLTDAMRVIAADRAAKNQRELADVSENIRWQVQWWFDELQNQQYPNPVRILALLVYVDGTYADLGLIQLLALSEDRTLILFKEYPGLTKDVSPYNYFRSEMENWLQPWLPMPQTKAAVSTYEAAESKTSAQAQQDEEILLSPVGKKPEGYELLTIREQEAFMLLALGYGAKEIADKWVISPRTVEKHIENIGDKLGKKGGTPVLKEVAKTVYGKT